MSGISVCSKANINHQTWCE